MRKKRRREDKERGDEENDKKTSTGRGKVDGNDNDPTCQVCGQGHLDEEWVLLCDGCGQEFHTYCLSPPLHEIPAGDWYCPLCCPVGRTRELEAYFAAHEKSRKEISSSEQYHHWLKCRQMEWKDRLVARGFSSVENDSEIYEDESLIGQLVLLHTDEHSVHSGRVVDCRNALWPPQIKSKIPKLQFQLHFKSAVDGRNKAFTHWCTLEEHACAVGEVRLCLASVVVHKLWTTTNEDPKPCYEFRRSSMGLAIRPDISKQSMSEALAEPKVLSTSAAGEEDAAVEGGDVTARSSASSTDKLVCIRLFSKRCNQYANVVDRGSSWCFVQRSVLRPFRIPDDRNKEDTILFWMAVAEKTERDSAVWTYRFRHIRSDVGGALQSWGNEFGLVDGFKLKHWKALMQFYNLSSAMHDRRPNVQSLPNEKFDDPCKHRMPALKSSVFNSAFKYFESFGEKCKRKEITANKATETALPGNKQKSHDFKKIRALLGPYVTEPITIKSRLVFAPSVVDFGDHKREMEATVDCNLDDIIQKQKPRLMYDHGTSLASIPSSEWIGQVVSCRDDEGSIGRVVGYSKRKVQVADPFEWHDPRQPLEEKQYAEYSPCTLFISRALDQAELWTNSNEDQDHHDSNLDVAENEAPAELPDTNKESPTKFNDAESLDPSNEVIDLSKKAFRSSGQNSICKSGVIDLTSESSDHEYAPCETDKLQSNDFSDCEIKLNLGTITNNSPLEVVKVKDNAIESTSQCDARRERKMNHNGQAGDQMNRVGVERGCSASVSSPEATVSKSAIHNDNCAAVRRHSDKGRGHGSRSDYDRHRDCDRGEYFDRHKYSNSRDRDHSRHHARDERRGILELAKHSSDCRQCTHDKRRHDLEDRLTDKMDHGFHCDHNHDRSSSRDRDHKRRSRVDRFVKSRRSHLDRESISDSHNRSHVGSDHRVNDDSHCRDRDKRSCSGDRDARINHRRNDRIVYSNCDREAYSIRSGRSDHQERDRCSSHRTNHDSHHDRNKSMRLFTLFKADTKTEISENTTVRKEGWISLKGITSSAHANGDDKNGAIFSPLSKRIGRGCHESEWKEIKENGSDDKHSKKPPRSEHRVRISGLAIGTTWKDLKKLFKKETKPIYVDLRGKGNAVGEFAAAEDVALAIDAYDGIKFKGSRITVTRDQHGEDDDAWRKYSGHPLAHQNVRRRVLDKGGNNASASLRNDGPFCASSNGGMSCLPPRKDHKLHSRCEDSNGNSKRDNLRLSTVDKKTEHETNCCVSNKGLVSLKVTARESKKVPSDNSCTKQDKDGQGMMLKEEGKLSSKNMQDRDGGSRFDSGTISMNSRAKRACNDLNAQEMTVSKKRKLEDEVAENSRKVCGTELKQKESKSWLKAEEIARQKLEALSKLLALS